MNIYIRSRVTIYIRSRVTIYTRSRVTIYIRLMFYIRIMNIYIRSRVTIYIRSRVGLQPFGSRSTVYYMAKALAFAWMAAALGGSGSSLRRHDFLLHSEGQGLLQHVTGIQYAHNSITGELTPLEHVQPSWGLEWHEGQLIAFSGEQSLWLQDCFKQVVYKCSTTEQILIHDTAADQKFMLEDFGVKHCPCDVRIPVTGSGDGAQLMVFAFMKAFMGFRWWWSLHDLVTHTLLPTRRGAKQGSKAAWLAVQKRWNAWSRTSQECGLPALRKAKAHMSEGNAVSLETARETGRVLGVPTCTTGSLLASLATMSFATAAKGGCAEPATSLACRALLAGLLGRCRTHQFLLVLGSDVELHPCGLWEAPLSPVAVPMTGGALQLRPFKAALPHVKKLKAQLGKLLAVADECPLPEFLSLLVGLGTPATFLLKQLVWQIGAAIEGQLDEEMQAGLAGQRQDKHALNVLRDGLSESERQQRSIAYMEAGLEVMKGHRFFSWGCDASRVGFKSRTAAVLALPDNKAFWLPPQVLGQGNERRPHTIVSISVLHVLVVLIVFSR